jgi:hypothetical protein
MDTLTEKPPETFFILHMRKDTKNESNNTGLNIASHAQRQLRNSFRRVV